MRMKYINLTNLIRKEKRKKADNITKTSKSEVYSFFDSTSTTTNNFHNIISCEYNFLFFLIVVFNLNQNHYIIYKGFSSLELKKSNPFLSILFHLYLFS